MITFYNALPQKFRAKRYNRTSRDQRMKMPGQMAVNRENFVLDESLQNLRFKIFVP